MSENINLRPISELTEVESLSAGDKILLNSNGEAKLIDAKKVGGSGSGLPTGGEPHQMLVTDAEGNTVWDDRTHWAEIVEAKLLPETTLTYVSSLGAAAMSQRLGFVVGNNYKIKYNGVEYNCIAVETEFYGFPIIACGNANLFSSSLAATSEPFAVVEFVEEDPLGMGVNAAVRWDDGDTAVVSINGLKEEVHKIPAKYLEGGNDFIENGSQGGSLRTITSTEEGHDGYKIGYAAFAEGRNTKARGDYSHAEGHASDASGEGAHAEGYGSDAIGAFSHAGNFQTRAIGDHSHTEGSSTEASGEGAHAQGKVTKASGDYSHAEGERTEAASPYQHVQGRYNIIDGASKYAHIVGNGSAEGNRANAHTLDWNGNAWYAGTVEGTAMIVKSTTPGSTKRFKITVDDSGTLSAVELTE